MTPPLIQAEGLTLSHGQGAQTVTALVAVDIELRPGELVGVVGPSGSGKTTLLSVLAGIDRPDSGRLRWRGEETNPANLGWRDISLVPQALGLLDELDLHDNITLPGRLAGATRETSAPRAAELIELLDLASCIDRLPRDASLGEQQRAAVARAALAEPRLLLADEPTAHQDSARARAVIDCLRRATHAGTCCVVATHDAHTIARVDRVLHLDGGRLTPP